MVILQERIPTLIPTFHLVKVGILQKKNSHFDLKKMFKWELKRELQVGIVENENLITEGATERLSQGNVPTYDNSITMM